MLDIEPAINIVLEHITPLPMRMVALREALFCTLGEAVRSDLDSPPFDRSLMDGYAVRAADTLQVPTLLRVVGQIGAGAVFEGELKQGEAIQINTGAPMPRGADAVVRVEDTQLNQGGKTVEVSSSVIAGQAVTFRAAFRKSGDVVLPAGVELTPVEIAAAASAGASQVRVYQRPRVALISTGDELVDVADKPGAGQIRDSNSYLLEALFHQRHVQAFDRWMARDDRSDILKKISAGLSADLLCISGGVSMGEFDFVPEILRELGATLRVHRLSIKPGKPTIFATMPDGKPIFALPGNPGSAFVGFQLLIRPALGALQGSKKTPRFMQARLLAGLKATGSRRAFVPAHAILGDDGQWAVQPLSWGGSGDCMGLCGCNALVMHAPDSPPLPTGSAAPTLLLDRD